MSMLRRWALSVLALSVVTAAGFASDTKEASGTVKSVAASSFVVTDAAGKDWSFGVDKNTLVLVKGGSHKANAIKANGKPSRLSEYLSAEQDVKVDYWEKDGKMMAKEVRVKDAVVR